MSSSKGLSPAAARIHEAYSTDEDENTALKKHVAFFDRNGDGVIYPRETYQGFRAIGCGVALSAISAVLINSALSKKTRPGKGFSMSLPIEIDNIKFAKHATLVSTTLKEGLCLQSSMRYLLNMQKQTQMH
ncbi:hypothetical protein QQ045_017247 [Rhodiola kirilowii]